MYATSIGDLARGLMMRSRSHAIKSTIATLTQELSSGQTADVTRRTGGDLSVLADITHNLEMTNGFLTVSAETAHFAQAIQTSLEAIQAGAATLGNDLLATVPSNLPAQRMHLSGMAEDRLGTTIDLLNGAAAGRSLFAGVATDALALGDAQALLTSLRTETAGLTTAADIEAAVDAWFAAPAGFQSALYQGATDRLGPVQVSATDQVALTPKADDAEFKLVLRNLAIAALATDPTLGLAADQQNALLISAGSGLLTAEEGLTAIRAEVGQIQSRIDLASARNAAARTSFEYAQAQLLEADAYDTATRLEEAQFQLESLYAATVRSSQLSLARFLS